MERENRKRIQGNDRPPHRVPVCDDERHIVRLIQVNLERQRYDVEVAFEGAEALNKMRARRPDLLILDTRMPGMSGWDVLRAMAEEPALRDIPVVLLRNARDDDGEDDPPPPPPPTIRITVTKPFNPIRLFEVLQ